MNEKKTVETKKNKNVSSKKVTETIKEKPIIANKQEDINKQLQKQNEELQKKLDALLAGVSLAGASLANNQPSNNKQYTITTKMVNGMTLTSPNGEVVIDVKHRQTVETTYDDVFQLMKNTNIKNSFTKGIVEFENDDSYKDFNIKKFTKIKDSELIDLFTTKSRTTIIEQLSKWTNDKKDNDVVHMLYNTLCSLTLDVKLDLPQSKVGIIKDYFNVELELGVNNLRIYREYMNR